MHFTMSTTRSFASHHLQKKLFQIVRKCFIHKISNTESVQVQKKPKLIKLEKHKSPHFIVLALKSTKKVHFCEDTLLAKHDFFFNFFSTMHFHIDFIQIFRYIKKIVFVISNK